MYRSRLFIGTFCLGATLFALTASAPPARAQKVRGSDEKRLIADKLSSAERAEFDTLRKGDKDVRSDQKALLEKAARSFVYPLTYTEVQEESSKGIAGISRRVREAMDQIPDLRKANPRDAARTDRQRRFVQEYGKALVPVLEEVLKNREPIARINAARILARLGDTGAEEFSDPLARAVEDKDQLDAVKLYALRGLKELFQSVEKFKDPEREARAVGAVVAFIHRPPSGGPTPEEVNAFHYVRREAVAALAQCRAPALEINKKVVSQPALELLRVVSRDSFDPSSTPILSERVEAAIGACTEQTSRYEKFYNPDYAAQQVGFFLVEFVNKYHADRQKQQPVADEPWKIHAARLRQAVQAMQNENRKNAYVIELASKADGILQQVEKGLPVTILPTGKWLEDHPPPSKSLYKNDPKAVVKRTAPTEA